MSKPMRTTMSQTEMDEMMKKGMQGGMSDEMKEMMKKRMADSGSGKMPKKNK
jgi:hypothetical protein